MGKPKKKKRKLSAYNKHMSREMKKGRTFKQAVASWKPGSKKSSPKKTGKSNPKGGTRKVTKNSFNMSKIYGLVRKVALFAPAAGIAMGPLSNADKMRAGIRIYTGYDYKWNEWKFEWLKEGWLPFVATSFITAIVPKINKFVKGLL